MRAEHRQDGRSQPLPAMPSVLFWVLFVFVFWDGFAVYVCMFPCCPGTCSGLQSRLTMNSDLPASAQQVLRLKACPTATSTTHLCPLLTRYVHLRSVLASLCLVADRTSPSHRLGRQRLPGASQKDRVIWMQKLGTKFGNICQFFTGK